MEAYQHSTGFDWTVMSANTGSIQERGEYTGRFRLGNQDELADRNGETYISRQDFAIAVIDMAESRTVTGKRVAVGHSIELPMRPELHRPVPVARDGIEPSDTRIFSPLLYQLSYLAVREMRRGGAREGTAIRPAPTK